MLMFIFNLTILISLMINTPDFDTYIILKAPNHGINLKNKFC